MSTVAQQAPTTPLFEGDDRLFRQELAACRVYGEYGCGSSTIWVAHHSNARILAVDSSPAWIAKVRKATADQSERISIKAIDLGELGDWGYPTTYRHRHHFRNYVHSPWQHGAVKPDLVLIDGRFRVACFLHSLLAAAPGTSILFDDYTNRPHYHLVEEFCPIEQTEGRQALFRVPEELDREAIGRELEGFLMVRD